MGNEPHTLLHCPHSSPLSHPAILSLTRALRRYDLCSWSSHTGPDSNKLPFSLGPVSLNSSANTTKHGLTLLPLHVHNSSTHSNLTFPNTNPQPLPGPYCPSFPPLSALALMIRWARCAKVPLTRKECFSVTYVTLCDICNAGWHMNCLLPPLTTIPAGIWKVPCAPLLPPHPRVHCDTSASPLPSTLTLTLTKHHLEKGEKKISPSKSVRTNERTHALSIPKRSQRRYFKKISFGLIKTLLSKNNKMPRMRRWRAYDEGSGFKLQIQYRGSPWGELGTST